MSDASGGPRSQPPLVSGVPRAISPLARRILAPNPGRMTGPGTNTYLVGVDEIAVIDPGPDDAGHLDAVASCGGGRIRWILTTHTHRDHWPGVPALRERTGAEVLGFTSRDGLEVDRELQDGDRVDGSEFRLTVVHTPGHASNHLCYLLEGERLLFSGDHVMQGSTVVIRSPDGDMAQYLTSLRRLKELRLRAIAPGHGHVIDDPEAAVDAYIAHRLDRERQVVDTVRAAGTATVDQIVGALYRDLVPELLPQAAHTVRAHLLKLAADGAVAGGAGEDEWCVVRDRDE